MESAPEKSQQLVVSLYTHLIDIGEMQTVKIDPVCKLWWWGRHQHDHTSSFHTECVHRQVRARKAVFDQSILTKPYFIEWKCHYWGLEDSRQGDSAEKTPFLSETGSGTRGEKQEESQTDPKVAKSFLGKSVPALCWWPW